MSLETAILENTKAVNRLADLMEKLCAVQTEGQKTAFEFLEELAASVSKEPEKTAVEHGDHKEAPEPISSPVSAPATAPASSPSPETSKEEPKPLTHEACAEVFTEKMRNPNLSQRAIGLIKHFVPEGKPPRLTNIADDRLPEFMKALEELQ